MPTGSVVTLPVTMVIPAVNGPEPKPASQPGRAESATAASTAAATSTGTERVQRLSTVSMYVCKTISESWQAQSRRLVRLGRESRAWLG